MEKTDILQQLLDLGQDWKVQDILINKDFKEIHIYVRYTKLTGIFPGTDESFELYDFAPSRKIRHLDLFEYKTFINVRLPRIKNDKGHISTIETQWADKRVSYTYLFEKKALEALQMSKNQTKTANYFDTSFDIVHGIMTRSGTRGLERRDLNGIWALGIDEKSYGSGQNYITILSDPVTHKVLDIIEGRTTDDAQELISWTISPSQLDKIELVAMDMWKPFMNAVTEIIPQADIVHDKFHTAKYLNKGVDNVRKIEVKEQEILKNNKYLFLKNKENWTQNQKDKFEQINQINLVTSQAWKIKENFKEIYNQGRKQQCLSFFEKWYINTIDSGIKPMIKVADTILKHLNGVINSALTHITNSIAENLNGQIQVVKSVARGFANVEGYRNSILFFNGKLEMYPL